MTTFPNPSLRDPAASAPIGPGLTNPIHDAQRAFRIIMDAMARPGRVVSLADIGPDQGPLPPAEAAIVLTLSDMDTPVWMSAATDAAAAYLTFHCGSPIVADPATACFALVTDARDLLPFDRFDLGDEAYPDRSATILVRLPALTGGQALIATGPGIETAASLAPQGLPDGFLSAWADNTADYPCGIDLILAAGDAIIALPRTCRLAPAAS